MKGYKPLVSSAPAHSILNARMFRYTSSVATDIRKTFVRVLRNRAKTGVAAKGASNVRPLTKNPRDTSVQAGSLQPSPRAAG
jgi:hypothetical protein